LHTPFPQVSPTVHAFPSLQGAVLLSLTQPEVGLQPSSVHGLLSLQLSAPVPGWQLPPLQASPVVQALPSLHGAVLLVKMHPDVGLQVSSVHGLLSLHTNDVPGLQIPPPQVSPVVQAFPSLHGAVLSVWTQPVCGLQLSSVHGLLSLQSTVDPVQTVAQVSPIAIESMF
jgi:hypothetical protein